MGTQLCNEKAQGQDRARGKKEHEETAQGAIPGFEEAVLVPKQALQVHPAAFSCKSFKVWPFRAL